AHDEIFHSDERGFYRETNRAGGLEGGMTTGDPLVVRAAMKPLPTLTKPLRSVDLESHEPAAALRERTDSCTVPAAGVVGEAMVWSRVSGDDTRPLARDRGTFAERFALREPLYAAVADAIVPSTAMAAAAPRIRALPAGSRLLWAQAASGAYPVYVGPGLLG